MHIQQTLVCSVEGNAPLGHGHHGIVIAQIWGQSQDSSIEQVGPAHIRCSGEGVRQVEQLVDGAAGDDISVEVDDLPELGLLPQIDFGEGGVQIGSIHEVEICRLRISYAWDGEYIVKDNLRAKRSAITPRVSYGLVEACLQLF